MSWILCKITLVRSSRCSRRRRINVADINTPVAVDQRAASYLEEAVRSFTVMRNRCYRLALRHLLKFTASFSSYSVLVDLPFPNSHHCGTVPLHTSFYCAIAKSYFSKADNPLPFKLRKLLEFLHLTSWRLTLV